MLIFKLSLATKSLLWVSLLTGIIFSGCSPVSELQRLPPPDESTKIDYSVIYYIHADSEYLYHNADGEPVKQNRQVLETARLVAETAKTGEVFIYHHLPEKKRLWFFPRNNNHMYHYINGKLVSHITYRHSDKNEAFLSTENHLFNQYRAQSRKENHRNYFLFFGHEIPDEHLGRYHHSLPKIAVNTRTFSAGIQTFLKTDDQRFNLIVLSSCNNGTYSMVKHLMPFSDALLASPQNLHLSHIDSNNLRLMDINPDIPSVQLAHAMADQTFRRLETEIVTSITLTVYDFDVLKEYKSELQHVFASNSMPDHMQLFSENIDCKQNASFDDTAFKLGLKTWYKPAKFGRNAHVANHSGWGCKPFGKISLHL